MDDAFVQDAEHDVDRDQRERDQERLARQRLLERLRRSLERTARGRRQADLQRCLVDRVDRLAERDGGREVERDRHRRELSLVVHRQRRLRLGHLRERRERHHVATAAAHEDRLQRLRVLLELRLHLEDHAVLVELRVHRRHLALAVGVVERVVDRRRGDAEPGRGVAIDLHVELQPLRLLVGVDVAQLRQRLELGEHFRRPLVELLEVRVDHRVLVLRGARPSAEPHVLHVLQEHLDPRHPRQLGPQLVDHLVGVQLARADRLELHEDEPRVALAHEADGVLDVRVLGQHLEQSLGARLHRRERDVLRRLRAARDRSRVLLRK